VQYSTSSYLYTIRFVFKLKYGIELFYNHSIFNMCSNTSIRGSNMNVLSVTWFYKFRLTASGSVFTADPGNRLNDPK